MKKLNLTALTLTVVLSLMIFTATATAGDWNDETFGGRKKSCPTPPVSKSMVPTNDNVFRENNLRLVAPSDLVVIPNESYNLAGLQLGVSPLEETQLTDSIQSEFAAREAGMIALTNSTERTLAGILGLTPIAAAAQLGNTQNVNNVAGEGIDLIIHNAIIE